MGRDSDLGLVIFGGPVFWALGEVFQLEQRIVKLGHLVIGLLCVGLGQGWVMGLGIVWKKALVENELGVTFFEHKDARFP